MLTQEVPVLTRTFTSVSSGSDIDCITSRPGYSEDHGGPALTGGKSGDTNRTRPTRLRAQTNGTVTIRYVLAHDRTSGAEIYWDDTVTMYAGELTEFSGDSIVAATTTADITICWPR